jgi:hypothetical protein
MKIKEGCTASTDDFWYDLTSGGYLNPEDILENKEDIDSVKNAIEIIQEFEQSCDEQIEDFIR